MEIAKFPRPGDHIYAPRALSYSHHGTVGFGVFYTFFLELKLMPFQDVCLELCIYRYQGCFQLACAQCRITFCRSAL